MCARMAAKAVAESAGAEDAIFGVVLSPSRNIDVVVIEVNFINIHNYLSELSLYLGYI